MAHRVLQAHKGVKVQQERQDLPALLEQKESELLALLAQEGVPVPPDLPATLELLAQLEQLVRLVVLARWAAQAQPAHRE